MKPLARLIGIGMIGLVGLGLLRGMPELPDFSLPEIDDRPLVTLNRGQRVTFDEPSGWHFPAGTVAEVWWCTGESAVIEGPADVEDVCALAMYD